MRKSKDSDIYSSKSKNSMMLDLLSQQPQLEFNGNREVVIEGSKGVIEYSEEIVRINTSLGLICFEGRSLNLRCISDSELIIDGFITKVEFIV
ncbi:MAG: hypothetical protein E7513_02265 [Ruminococcaceae bacterium]|nr:hypothetical protein [Oscillospiraceae bacterium]